MPGRRGRRSQDDYVEAIVALVRADIWTLKVQKAFADVAGVRALAAQFVGEAWPLGVALHLLIAGAVADVYGAACASPTRTSGRFAAFLRLWYDEHRTVTYVAAQLHLSRSHVAKAVQRPALRLVAQRFLALAQQADPTSQSEGVRRAAQAFRHPERRSGSMGPGGCPRRTAPPPARSA
jgi:hypothetical protein